MLARLQSNARQSGQVGGYYMNCQIPYSKDAIAMASIHITRLWMVTMS